VQAPRNLVAVLVELAARVELGHHNFGRTPLGVVLVIPLDTGRNTATVINHGDRVVGVDGDNDFITVASECLIDGVVHHLKDQMVQTGTVGGITDIHARAFSNRLQPFENLNG